MGSQPVRLAFIDTPDGEDHPGVGQGRDEYADAGGPVGDEVGDPHLGACPVDLHRMAGDVLDPGGESAGCDFLADQLAEPLVAVVAQTGGRQGEVVGPQDVEGCFLPPGPGGDDGVQVDGDELPGHGHPPVADQAVKVVVMQSVELGGGGDLVVIEGFPGFGDGGVRYTAAGLDFSVGTARQEQSHDQPVVGHG